MPQVEINETTGVANVAVTEQVAEVTVNESGDPVVVQITIAEEPEVIQVGIVGPQGPIGPTGPQGATGSSTLSGLTDVNVASKVNKSVLVYDQVSDKFVANDVNTVATLTDGGNF